MIQGNMVIALDEFTLIDSIKQQQYRQASLQKGVGDDAAVFRHAQEDIVTAVDLFVENVHFSRQTMSTSQIGYRALAANISDLAAMGAVPRYYLVAIVIPSIWKPEEIQEIFTGMNKLADVYEMDLIGGDTVSGDQLVLSITVFGSLPFGRARYRSDAKPGDLVFTTGTLGGSSAGLHILTHPDRYLHAETLIRHHQEPFPRVKFSNHLLNLERVALNDISDGIANELAEIAAASGVAIEIQDDMIPMSEGLHQFPKELQDQWKYFGGEDYELVGCVSEKEWPLLVEAAHTTNTKITHIGQVQSDPTHEGTVWKVNTMGKREILPKKGYTHLK